MARVWRPGQEKKVFLYRTLATGTIEGHLHIRTSPLYNSNVHSVNLEKIFQRQVSKLSLASNVVGGNADAQPDFTASYLFHSTPFSLSHFSRFALFPLLLSHPLS